MRSLARNGDFWSGLVLAGLGTYIVVEAWGWTYMGEEGPGPGFFPRWYGSLMVVLSLALVVSSALRKGAPRVAIRWNDVGRALTCWAAFVVSIALMPVAGFVVSFALLTWFIVAVMARRPQRVAVPLAVFGALGFYALFELALDLTLPHGLFF